MNKIQKMLAEHCPNGVEFKKLGNIAKRNSGTAITATQMKLLHCEGAPIRIFAGGSTIADVNEGDIPSGDVIRAPSLIVKSRGYIGFEYYEKPFSHKNELWSYTISDESINQKFIYYYLLTQTEKLQVLARGKSVKIPQLATPDTDKLKVPVPPLEVQHEIVKILDSFAALETELKVELEAELAARRRQYSHYRNALLSFDEETINAAKRSEAKRSEAKRSEAKRSEAKRSEAKKVKLGDLDVNIRILKNPHLCTGFRSRKLRRGRQPLPQSRRENIFKLCA